ncbi:MAG: hypothetical protein HYU54_08135 [Actinobacteria bacterium]|nr:hypothetical protein [Actinomycetota bacterium]
MNGGAIRVLRLSGTPGERGIEHGRQVPDLIAYYWSELARDVSDRAARPMTEPELRAWVVERAAPAIDLAPDLDEEIRGIGEGSGLGYEAALGVNLFEEISGLAHVLGRRPDVPTERRCSSIAIGPERSATGGWLFAQTWDGADWYDDPLLFVVEEETGASAYLTDAGIVGGVGVNDRGLASVHTGVGLVEHVAGLPYAFIARRILQAPGLEEAAASVVDLPSTAGCHYVVGNAERALDVEAAGAAHSTSRPTAAFSTCAHFEDPACAAGELEGGRAGSVHRTSRLVQRAAERDGFHPEDLLELLADHVPGPDGITVCRHPDASSDTRSAGAIAADPLARRLLARAGNPCEDRPAVEVRLGEDEIEVASPT